MSQRIRPIAVLGALLGAGLLLPCLSPIASAPASEPGEPRAIAVDGETARQAPVVELAILLDNSGSMSGLIDQARQRIWSIVNELARTRKDGQIPDLRVALYSYSLGTEVRQLLPLSTDLDAVSEALFAIEIEGGSEFCGYVIQRSLDDLQWSAGDHYRAIVIAGNEPFTQGPQAYQKACAAAIARGIVVNTIHCGKQSEAESGEWIAAARLADGDCINIDHNHRQQRIDAPQDARITELNGELNDTYIAYGARGAERLRRQAAQDANAGAAAPAAMADRAAAKSSSLYRNTDWDLVDAVEEGDVALDSLEAEQLPEELRGKSAEELRALVAEKAERRTAVQQELSELVAERQRWVTAERERRAESGEAIDTFGSAMRKLLKKQLASRGYQSIEE